MKTSQVDFEDVRQEMRECAEQVWSVAQKKMKKLRRGVVIGWTCLFGWLFFMLAAGMSISEKIHPGIFWGLAAGGIVVMILRHRSLRKRSLALYQKTCLVPLFRSLGDWISYDPEKGIEREELQQPLVPEDIVEQRELKGFFEHYKYAGRGWVLIKAGSRSSGEHLVQGELLGVPFETAPTKFEETLYGGSSVGVSSTHRTAFYFSLDKPVSSEIFLMPNIMRMLKEGLPGMIFKTMIDETPLERLIHQVSFEAEDRSFDEKFMVLCKDADVAKEVLGPEVRASLKELSGDIGLVWPGVTIRDDKLLLLESTPNPLFYPDHPEQMNFPARADDWLELLARCVMLVKEVESNLDNT